MNEIIWWQMEEEEKWHLARERLVKIGLNLFATKGMPQRLLKSPDGS